MTQSLVDVGFGALLSLVSVFCGVVIRSAWMSSKLRGKPKP